MSDFGRGSQSELMRRISEGEQAKNFAAGYWQRLRAVLLSEIVTGLAAARSDEDRCLAQGNLLCVNRIDAILEEKKKAAEKAAAQLRPAEET